MGHGRYVKIFIYEFWDIGTKCRTRYLLSVSPARSLTTTPLLLLFPTDRKLKDYVCTRGDKDSLHFDLWYKLIEKILVNGVSLLRMPYGLKVS